MAAPEMAGIGSTEDTLSQSPGENRAGHHVTRRVHEADHELSFSLGRGGGEQLPPNRIRGEHAEQEEQQPPSPASQRVEPQRRQERDHQRLEQPPRVSPAAVTPKEIPSADRQVHALSDRRRYDEPCRDREPREKEPRERHCLARCPGGTYPGPRKPRPGRAAGGLPWSSSFWPVTN